MTHSFPTRRASDLARQGELREAGTMEAITDVSPAAVDAAFAEHGVDTIIHGHTHRPAVHQLEIDGRPRRRIVLGDWYEQGSVRSEEHTSELQPLMRTSYAVFCLTEKKPTAPQQLRVPTTTD